MADNEPLLRTGKMDKCSNFSSFLISLSHSGSPSLPTNGTVLNGNAEPFFPSLPSPPNSVASTTANTSGSTPVPTSTASSAASSLIPPAANSVYLPPFPFAPHPDLLHKSPFMPYGALRAHPAHLSSSEQQINSARLSPASSRNSSSSPAPNSQSTPNHKINSSIELNSTHEHSSHSSSEDSEDEQIDVVKSAFVPILRPTLSATITTTSTPDSTVREHSPSREIPIKIKCELKAPSSKKLQLHEKASHQDGSQSPETKIKTQTITQQQKTVWRPY